MLIIILTSLFLTAPLASAKTSAKKGNHASPKSIIQQTLPALTGELGTFSTTGQGQLPKPLYEHTTVTATTGTTTYIYVLGGFTQTSQTNQTFTDVYKATIDSSGNIGSFSSLNQGQLPKALRLHTTVTVNTGGTNYIYVLGGRDIYGRSSEVYKATINSSGDIGAFSTTNQGQLPQPLNAHATVIANIGGINYIYVLGGNNGVPQTTVYKATIDVTGDIGPFSTSGQGQLPHNLMSHSTAVMNIGGRNYIYVLGGVGTNSTDGSLYESTAVYKAAIDSSGNIGAFSTVNQGQLPQIQNWHSIASLNDSGNNFIYILGGYPNKDETYRTIVDTSGNAGIFSTTTLLPKPLYGHTSVIAITGTSAYLYVLGGNSLNTVQSAVYKAQIN